MLVAPGPLLAAGQRATAAPPTATHEPFIVLGRDGRGTARGRPQALRHAAAIGAAAAAVSGRAAARQRRRKVGLAAKGPSAAALDPEAVARAFVASDASALPKEPTELQLAKLLTWVRAQDAAKVHPGVACKDSHLVCSMPVSAGTPLAGIRSELFFSEAASAEGVADIDKAASGPEDWQIRLGMRILQESRDPSSPRSAHLASLSERPASALLWSVAQANELQYLPAKRLIADRLLALNEFYEGHVKDCDVAGAPVERADFVAAVASATSRGVEVRPGERALVPLVDLVGPPEVPGFEGIVLGNPPRAASCEIQVEDGLVMLVAARDISPGEALTRDVGLDAEELLLRYGVATCDRPGDEVLIWAGVGKKNANPWQVKEIVRAVATEASGQDGGYFATSRVRRGRSWKEAVDKELMYCARVLACETKDDFFGEELWAEAEPKPKAGLEGLTATGREAALSIMVAAVSGAKEALPSTLEDDSELLPLLVGPENRNRLAATLYRAEKKRILDDVLRVLGSTLNRDIEKRDRRRREKDLPAALTGRKKKTTGQGFG